MQQRYPRAGAKNPSVRAGILDLKTKKTTWLTLPGGGEHYLGRFQLGADGKALWFQALTRDQHRLSVLRADAATGAVREVWSADVAHLGRVRQDAPARALGARRGDHDGGRAQPPRGARHRPPAIASPS